MSSCISNLNNWFFILFIFHKEIRRKSNVVKEIEKIQKNREQRRAKQEEKRQRINETDTTVPAWEFANMISEFRAGIDFSRITNSENVQDLRICVCVRKRPINKKGTFKSNPTLSFQSLFKLNKKY